MHLILQGEHSGVLANPVHLVDVYTHVGIFIEAACYTVYLFIYLSS